MIKKFSLYYKYGLLGALFTITPYALLLPIIFGPNRLIFGLAFSTFLPLPIIFLPITTLIICFAKERKTDNKMIIPTLTNITFSPIFFYLFSMILAIVYSILNIKT